MSAQLYIARLIEEGRSDRGPNATFRLGDARRAWQQERSWRPRKGPKD